MTSLNFSLASPLALALSAPLIVLGIYAAWLDLNYRLIPNWLCGFLAIIGFVISVYLGGANALFMHGLHFGLALVLGMILFGLGIFGGGDAKFYAAVSAWFPVAAWAKLALYISLSGLGLLVVWFCYRRLSGKKMRPKNPTIYDSLPYGIAIATGAIAMLIR